MFPPLQSTVQSGELSAMRLFVRAHPDGVDVDDLGKPLWRIRYAFWLVWTTLEMERRWNFSFPHERTSSAPSIAHDKGAVLRYFPGRRPVPPCFLVPCHQSRLRNLFAIRK
jgi:hypothetical protein